MHKTSRASEQIPFRRSLLLVAITGALLSAASPSNALTIPKAYRGVVAGSYFAPPAGASASSTVASYYQNARVCVDTNNNGVCDFGEASAMTDLNGAFTLKSAVAGPLIAETSTTWTTNAGHPVVQRAVFRASLDQVAAGAVSPLIADVVLTPLSTEVVRMMEADGLDYPTAKQNLVTRLGVTTTEVLSDPTKLPDGAAKTAWLTESVILSNRFGLAAKMVDRGDVSPAALAVNPNAVGPAITMKEAHQAVMSVEGIPRYDHIFVIMLENKATSSIKGSVFAPKINAYLSAGNQFTSYFATGNPSEPNRLAVGAGDDFGITDDNAVNCMPAGDTADAMEDPAPAGLAPCVNATNHNIKNKPNLFTALAVNGMTWRIYSESVNPNRDVLLDGAADPTVTALDHVYTAADPVGPIGKPGLVLPFPAALYRPKHNSSVNFQNVRNLPDFRTNNRTLGGGQWDDSLKAVYPGWEVDQFGKDLASGDVGHLNFLEPDQCDDMHNITVQGTIPPSTTKITASDCGSGNPIIYRGDNYTDYLIKKIQASSIWTNPQKRVAIVIMFDEGTATTGFNSCCGWNPSAGSSIAGKSLGVLVKNADGSVSVQTIDRYNQGNKGHGTSIYGVLNNQPSAPKGVVDSDAYSHISFVRTLQDMFGVADAGDDWSYMNRSKYTEKFIAANILYLPEYAGSADPHFDAVRPMNHKYVIPATYVQKSGFVTPPGPQVGPDANQINAWALK